MLLKVKILEKLTDLGFLLRGSSVKVFRVEYLANIKKDWIYFKNGYILMKQEW